jgi:SPP1 gp7 family putative phage head morphogenesis protein
MRSLKPIRPPVAIEREYHKKLKALLQEMDKSLYWWLRAEYRKAEPEIVGDSAMSDLRDKLKKLVREWMKKFSDKAKEIASWFAGKVQGYTTNNLQQQMKKAKLAELGFDLKFSYHSRKERAVFNSIVEQNVNLIKSIASEHLTKVQGVVLRGIETGHDLSRMTQDLEEGFGVTERRAAMIARDQTAKASNNLSRQRLLDYGVTKGKWMHTSSGKTYRDSHVQMDGEIYDIEEGCYDDDYGDYVQPGELVNCHCVCVPVIDFNQGGDTDDNT